MIQDIAPKKLYNQFKKKEAGPDSLICFFSEAGLLVRTDENRDPGGDFPQFPRLKELPEVTDTEYLFSVDETEFFLALRVSGAKSSDDSPPDGFEFRPIMQLRDIRAQGGADMYAAFTAYHLWKWYSSNRFCGVCGHPLERDDRERALTCPKCGGRVYPRLNPAVIVGVINGDRLLITRYRTGYGHSALIAGFTEIGETFEETVAREVMEEAGVSVKNIRYYKSQPWAPAEDILAGFFCEVDGDDTIRMDAGELRYAEWVRREDIILQPSEYSLTNEMMKMFKEGGITKP